MRKADNSSIFTLQCLLALTRKSVWFYLIYLHCHWYSVTGAAPWEQCFTPTSLSFYVEWLVLFVCMRINAQYTNNFNNLKKPAEITTVLLIWQLMHGLRYFFVLFFLHLQS